MSSSKAGIHGSVSIAMVVILLAARGTLCAAAPTFRVVCIGSGFASPTPSTPLFVPFNSLSSSTGQFTTATAGVTLSGRLTINTAGLVCRYTQSSGTFIVNSDGSGSAVGTFAPIAGNSAKCPPAFTAHTDTTGAADGTSRFVNTDFGSTGSGTCAPH